MNYVRVKKDGTISLPRGALKAFPALSELAIWWKGDALILKRISPSLPSEFAERSPQKGPSLREISKEIRGFRKSKKSG